MKKRNNKKGFTLAELLIVVAIIAVLVAIAIPIFTSQLEKSRESTDLANIRSAYAEASTKALDSSDGTGSQDSQPMTQTTSGWDQVDNDAKVGSVKVKSDDFPEVSKGDVVTVTIGSNGKATFAKKN